MTRASLDRQSWRCSTISIRRFCSRPSAVALGAIGSASARPSALTRAGSPHAARDDRAHGVGARGRELEVGGKLHAADRLVVGVVDHPQRSRLVPQCRGDALQQRQRRGLNRPRCRTRTSRGRRCGRSASRRCRAALTAPLSISGLQAGAQPVERGRVRRRRWRGQRLHDRRARDAAACARAGPRARGPAGHRTPRSDAVDAQKNSPPHTAAAAAASDPDRHAAPGGPIRRGDAAPAPRQVRIGGLRCAAIAAWVSARSLSSSPPPRACR